VGVDPNIPFIPTDRFLLALPVVGLIAGIFLILSLLFGILYSHRLAGPIYRIEKTILQLINGARNFKVKLRKRDEFKKLAETLNKLIGYFEANSKDMIRIKNLIEDYEKTKDPELLDRSKKILEQHIEELHQ
jgi:signal transduction histidine kinase